VNLELLPAQGPVDVNVRPQFPTKTRDVIYAPHAQFASWCHGAHAYEHGDVLAAAAVCREDALLAYLGDALSRLPVEGEDDCITQAREFMTKMMGPNANVTGAEPVGGASGGRSC
jgi:hypothetical protein